MTRPARGVRFDVVIPTVGRPSLQRLLDALAAQSGPMPRKIVVVQDRARLGPAAARNIGWRAADAEWVVFLDDDVVPPSRWSEMLVRDLAALAPTAAASQGRVRVPLARSRRPTDWERNVAGLQQARWASADIAYRRDVLERVGGFDERFARAYREDSDLALRVIALGYGLERGARCVEHPVGPASFWHSVRLQRGNADDALMRRLHGRRWRERAQAPAGRLARHLAISASALAAAPLALLDRRRLAQLSLLASMVGIGELSWLRIAPGPRTPVEVARMLATSAVIPFAASAQRMRGELRWRRAKTKPAIPSPGRRPPAAVLFDRDGTLIEDVPYNGDPELVTPLAGAREALQMLREANVPIAVISNQSGVARGLIGEAQVDEVNRRVEELLGPVDRWLYCPHAPGDGCDCRKPAPGLVIRAARSLGVAPERCAVVGDIAADVQAAAAAGARGVLVPNGRTLRAEVQAASETAPDPQAAVKLLLGEDVLGMSRGGALRDEAPASGGRASPKQEVVG